MSEPKVHHDENIRIYGGDDSAVYSAPKGTAFPIGLELPAIAWADYGLLSEDGITLTQKSDTKEIRVHQGARLARTKVLHTQHGFKFFCSETTAKVLGLVYPAAVFTTDPATGLTTITDVEKEKADERAWIIDEFDEGIQKRLLYTRAQVTARADIAHKADAPTLYEFTVTNYGPIVIVTNDPAVATPAA